MKLRINPFVAADLKEIRDFIADDNPNKAAETIDNIYQVFEQIQQFPGLGASLSNRVSFKTDYKFMVWENYIVIYKFENEYVEIYRVINRFRDITKIFDS